MFIFYYLNNLLYVEPDIYEPYDEKGIGTIIKENYQLILIAILSITTIIFFILFLIEKKKK